MSMVFESSRSSRIERSGLHHHGMAHGTTATAVVYESPDSERPGFGIFSGDRRRLAMNSMEDRIGEEDSTSSSSIGVNSNTSEGERDSDEAEVEVQSSLKESLDSLESLEEVLPIKRGMSKFYNGKSKSFTSLADAAYCRSIKDIVKPEDAYTRKRKNLLAHSILWDKNLPKPSTTNTEGGLSKKPANTSRNNLGMAIRIINNNNGEHSSSTSASASASPVRSRPPLHPQTRKSSNQEEEEEDISTFPSTTTTSPRKFPSWRSFSLSDLQTASGQGNAKT